MTLEEELGKKNEGNKQAHNDCPQCGSCPHCGRPNNQPIQPYYPSYPTPTYPYSFPPNGYPTIWC